MRRSRIVDQLVVAVFVTGLLAGVCAWTPRPLAAVAGTASPTSERLDDDPAPAVPGEIVKYRTATSRTVKNPDGRLTTSVFSAPIHYADRKGVWQQISGDLVADAQDGYAWRNKANRFTTRFKNEPSGDYLRLEVDGRAVSLSLPGAQSSVASVANGKLSYVGVLPGVDVDYQPLPEGVKETLVIRDRTAPARFRFLLKAGGAGLDAQRRPDGSWAFYSPSGEPILVLAEPTVEESRDGVTLPLTDPSITAPSATVASSAVPSVAPSPTLAPSTVPSAALSPTPQPSVPSAAAVPSISGLVSTAPSASLTSGPPAPTAPSSADSSAAADQSAPASGSPAPSPSAVAPDPTPTPTQSAAATAASPAPELSVSRVGDAFALDLSLDRDWLNDPARRFPILLDPTLSIQPTIATNEASFIANSPSTYGRGTRPRLHIGADDTYIWRAALQFDIGAIPAGATITNAELGLFYDKTCMDTTCGSTSHALNVHRMSSPWSNDSLSGDLRFDSTALAGTTLAVNSSLGWLEWSGSALTTTVKNWYLGSDTNNGFLVKRSTEAVGSGGPTPASRNYHEPSVTPRLDVTWSGDGVTLYDPDTLHADGAELSWTKYAGASTFTSYEVHRSATKRFIPTSATLLATISDVDTLSYRDTTAAPSKTFYYQVVATGHASNERAVTLPGAGKSTKLVQGSASVDATWLAYSTGSTYCGNNGAYSTMHVGMASTAYRRSLVRFDVRDIPSDATISAATASLWYDPTGSGAFQVNAHRATRPWREGTGKGTCTGDGATWYDTHGPVRWTSAGGDFDATAAASVNKTSRSTPDWDEFGITPLVQDWVSGKYPNHGLVLKASSEALADGKSFYYLTDNASFVPTLRPKLSVTYSDGSRSRGPRVAVTSPAPGAKLSGTAAITASASDDRRVDKVEFLVDGAVKAAVTSQPFSYSWNTTGATNGSHTLTARATDDVGNVTTSAAVAVTVANSARPSASVTSPAPDATVAGVVTVSADASDDGGVAKVEFYFDDILFAEDAGAPFSASWDTTNALEPAYDGPHALHVKAYDADGQVTASSAVGVTVANRSGPYRATIADPLLYQALDEDELAGGRTLDPTASQGKKGLDAPPQDSTPQTGQGSATSNCTTESKANTASAGYKVRITITNASSVAWHSGEVSLWYRWYTKGGDVVFEGKGADLPTVQAGDQHVPWVTVLPPALCFADQLDQLRLRFDLYHDPDGAGATPGVWFAQKGNPPVDRPVAVGKELQVAKALNSALGLERYYHYVGEEAGAGMGHLVNVANGNSILRWSPWAAPGRGLSTLLDLTYNSLERHSDSPVGNNFSVSVSSLSRFGLPLDIHPNKADELEGNANRWVEFTDGDGTTHRFEGKTAADGSVFWEEPPGVHLYLRQFSSTDLSRKWAVTRPDRVTFFYDDDGFPTSVEDKNGNRLTFTLEATPPGEDPGGAKKRITRVTDAGGRDFSVLYYAKAEAKKPQIRGKIKRITDHTGSALDFEYYLDGNLLRIVQRGGTTATGEFLADRSFVFSYTTPSGDGPAIPLPADRVDPDPKTTQATRLYSVRDPKGAETLFSYYGPGSGILRGKLQSRTDRAGSRTDFSYDAANRVTTVTAPLSRVSKYAYDTTGKVMNITNPKNEITSVTWTGDFMVAKVTEPTGKFSEFSYNDNGYLLRRWDQLRNLTELSYQNVGVDGNDVTGEWKTGRTIPHVSQLATKTDPKGSATASPIDDYQWSFAYDAKGNLVSTTDPLNAVTKYAYNTDGTLAQVEDAIGVSTTGDATDRLTKLQNHDANGFPTLVIDAESGQTRFGFDADGNLLWTQDPNHAANGGMNGREYRSYFDYDSFGRLGRQSAPKSTSSERGLLIWSAAEYDANDNLTRQIGPHYGQQYTGTGAVTKLDYDAMDRQLLVTGADTTVDPAGERIGFAYDAAGRLTRVTAPEGTRTTASDKDFATFYGYDALDRVVSQTHHRVDGSGVVLETRSSYACYDTAGDLRWVTAPKAGLSAAPTDCSTSGATPPGYTRRLEYDAAHRPVSQTDALGHASRVTLDANGNVATMTDANGKAASRTYDERDQVASVVEPFVSGGRNVTTRYEYDLVGNLKRFISPRGVDAAGTSGSYTHFVTSYRYDELNRMTRVDLPTSSSDPLQLYIHRGYDRNGNLLSTSLPTRTALASDVPAASKHVLSYFDPGWIRTSDDPNPSPRLYFDYTAEGWQSERVPGSSTNLAQAVLTRYYPDGLLKSTRDRGGQSTSYTYDANNQLATAKDASGLTDPAQALFDLQVTRTGFGELAKVNQKLNSAGTDNRFTEYAYDANGNLVTRKDDARTGSVSQAARVHTFSYDGADWLTTQLDDFRTAADTSDDQHVTNSFYPTGWEKQRVIRKGGATGSVKQTTDWAFFDNGRLRTLTIKDAAGTVVEDHSVGYLDPDNLYVNGFRTRDSYVLDGPGTDACTLAARCLATYTYDARDRLKESSDGHGGGVSYTLDDAANVTREVITGTGAKTTDYSYSGNQLQTSTVGTSTQNYFYDPDGNLDCVTIATGTQADCGLPTGGTPSVKLLADYTYDYLNRLAAYRSFLTNGTSSAKDDTADYTYDALDRVVKEIESHGSAAARTTSFGHLGLSSLVISENQTGGPSAVAKGYSYDAYGHRLGMTNQVGTGTLERYSYGYDVHGSVSLLLQETGGAKASYGYRPYGAADPALTSGDFDPSEPTQTRPDDPLNAYRYTAKRYDSGSDSLDMGARRFGPDTNRFLQADQYQGALADLGLSLDPLTANRYSLAGGNPVGFVEVDGHRIMPDGGGGSVTSPTTQYQTAYSSGSSSGSSTSAASAHGVTYSNTPEPTPRPGLPPDYCVTYPEQCATARPPEFTERGGGLDLCTGLSAHECLAQGAMVAETIMEGAVLAGELAATRGRSGGSLKAQSLLNRLGQAFSRLVSRRPTTMVPRASEIMSRLPKFTGGRTDGILDTGRELLELQSGYAGPTSRVPSGTRGFNNLVRGHVEGHAAAIMRLNDFDKATLYINNPPCKYARGWDAMLPHMLPPGSELTVYGPDNFFTVYRGLDE